MDLESHGDARKRFTITFGALTLFGVLLGTMLLFRRRKSRVPA